MGWAIAPPNSRRSLIAKNILMKPHTVKSQHKVDVQLNMASYIPMFCAGVPLPVSSEVSRHYLYRSKTPKGFITLDPGHKHPILKWQSIPIN